QDPGRLAESQEQGHHPAPLAIGEIGAKGVRDLLGAVRARICELEYLGVHRTDQLFELPLELGGGSLLDRLELACRPPLVVDKVETHQRPKGAPCQRLRNAGADQYLRRDRRSEAAISIRLDCGLYRCGRRVRGGASRSKRHRTSPLVRDTWFRKSMR